MEDITFNKFVYDCVVGTPLSTKRAIFLGDSYGEGYTPEGFVTSWWHLISALPFSYVIGKPVGGAGFVAGSTFLINLKSIKNEVESPKEITDIYVIGGYNDINCESIDKLKDAIIEFASYCETQYPIANVHIGFCAWNVAGDNLTALRNVYEQYVQCSYYGSQCTYISGIENVLHNLDYMSSDHFHPNANGQQKLYTALLNYINGNKINTYYNYTGINVTLNNNISGTASWGQYLKDSTVGLYMLGATYFLNSPYTKNGHHDGSGYITIGTMNNGFLVGDSSLLTSWDTNVIVGMNGVYRNCITTFKIVGTEVRMYLSILNGSCNGYESGSTGINCVIVPQQRVVFNTIIP